MSRHCPCAICKRHAHIDATEASRDVDALIALVDALHDDASHAEDRADHLACILDGSWPSAVEQLEAALVIAREKRAGGGEL